MVDADAEVQLAELVKDGFDRLATAAAARGVPDEVVTVALIGATMERLLQRDSAIAPDWLRSIAAELEAESTSAAGSC